MTWGFEDRYIKERDALRKRVAALEAERDALKASVAALMFGRPADGDGPDEIPARLIGALQYDAWQREVACVVERCGADPARGYEGVDRWWLAQGGAMAEVVRGRVAMRGCLQFVVMPALAGRAVVADCAGIGWFRCSECAWFVRQAKD